MRTFLRRRPKQLFLAKRRRYGPLMTIFRAWDTVAELFSATRLYSPLSVLDTSLMIRTHRLPDWWTAKRLDGTTLSSPRIHLQLGAGFPDTRASTLSLAPALALTVSGMTIVGSTDGDEEIVVRIVM